MFAQHVAGGAGVLGDDGGIETRERIEQGRFADVGLANDGDCQALAQSAALTGFSLSARQQRLQRAEAFGQSGIS